MSDIRRSKTMPASLASAGRPQARSATLPVARNYSGAAGADPFSMREFFHDRPAASGQWAWVMEDSESDVETEADSDDGARTPVSIAPGRRGAVFDFSQVYTPDDQGPPGAGRDSSELQGPGVDEARILQEDKLGVLRLTSGDLDFASLPEPWSALKGPGLDAGRGLQPSRAPSPSSAFGGAGSVGLEEPGELEFVHLSMCARREANTRRLIGAQGPFIPPGSLFLDDARAAPPERPLLARLVHALYAWL